MAVRALADHLHLAPHRDPTGMLERWIRHHARHGRLERALTDIRTAARRTTIGTV